MKKLFFMFALIFCFVLSFNVVLAQDDANDEATVVEDAVEITAEDLDIKEPKILPDSVWYGFKRFWEGTGNFFNFDKVKKAERKLEQANMRILEAKKLAEKTGKEEILEKALEKYDATMANIEKRVEKFKDKNSDKVEKFKERLTNMQLKQEQVLERIQKLKPEQQEKIKAVKEKIINRIGQVLESIESGEVQERLRQRLEERPEIREEILEARPQIRERIENRIQNDDTPPLPDTNMIQERLREHADDTPPMPTGQQQRKGNTTPPLPQN